MFPLIVVAFAGIGVTRLALLALELHESNNPEEASSPREAVVTKEATIEEMRRMEKPKKLVLKNECQYVCIWKEEDLNQDIPLEQLLQRSNNGEGTNDFSKAWQDMATFFERMVGKSKDKVESGGSQEEHEEGKRQGLLDTVLAGRVEGACEEEGKEERCGNSSRENRSNVETRGRESPASNSEETCLVCYDQQQNAVLLTCGHGSICFQCAINVFRTTRECPLCRSKVDQIVTVGEPKVLKNGLHVVAVTGPC